MDRMDRVGEDQTDGKEIPSNPVYGIVFQDNVSSKWYDTVWIVILCLRFPLMEDCFRWLCGPGIWRLWFYNNTPNGLVENIAKEDSEIPTHWRPETSDDLTPILHPLFGLVSYIFFSWLFYL